VVERLSYDPWGKRRFANGIDDPNNTITSAVTDRGFTGQEHLDEVGLIHLNGRVYDPLLGRFVSADPFIQDPANLQSYNRYTYGFNNPLAAADPTGYIFGIDDLIIAAVVIAASYQLEKDHVIDTGTRNLIWGVAVGWAFGPGPLALTDSTIINGAVGGFAAGYVGSGGNMDAAWKGAVGGAIFGFIGTYVPYERYPVENVLAHAAAGCLWGAASGGDCGSQAAAGAFGAVIGPNIPAAWGPVGGLIATTVIGGTASVIGGGKFENGAMTAAFGYLFNYLQHGRYLTSKEGQLLADQAALWDGTAYRLVGRNSKIQVAGDCSGTTYKIYDALGDTYRYVMADDFAAAAAKEGFPFQKLPDNMPRQPGDVLIFEGHMAIYAGQDPNGNGLMWTASLRKQQYMLQQIRFFGKPVVGTYRYQVPNTE